MYFKQISWENGAGHRMPYLLFVLFPSICRRPGIPSGVSDRNRVFGLDYALVRIYACINHIRRGYPWRKVAFWTALVVAIVFAAGTGFAAAPDKPIVLKAAKAKEPVAFEHAKHSKDCSLLPPQGQGRGRAEVREAPRRQDRGKKLSVKEAFLDTLVQGLPQEGEQGSLQEVRRLPQQQGCPPLGGRLRSGRQ